MFMNGDKVEKTVEMDTFFYPQKAVAGATQSDPAGSVKKTCPINLKKQKRTHFTKRRIHKNE